MGLRLRGITREDIHGIDGGYGRRSRLVYRWKERNGSNATYHAVITAMLAARKRNEAETVCRLLVPGEEISIQLIPFHLELFYNMCRTISDPTSTTRFTELYYLGFLLQ